MPEKGRLAPFAMCTPLRARTRAPGAGFGREPEGNGPVAGCCRLPAYDRFPISMQRAGGLCRRGNDARRKSQERLPLVRSYVGLAAFIALSWDFVVWRGWLVST